jgi:hypothetical protein
MTRRNFNKKREKFDPFGILEGAEEAKNLLKPLSL